MPLDPDVNDRLDDPQQVGDIGPRLQQRLNPLSHLERMRLAQHDVHGERGEVLCWIQVAGRSTSTIVAAGLWQPGT